MREKIIDENKEGAENEKIVIVANIKTRPLVLNLQIIKIYMIVSYEKIVRRFKTT
jgi:hypothetical protein